MTHTLKIDCKTHGNLLKDKILGILYVISNKMRHTFENRLLKK